MIDLDPALILRVQFFVDSKSAFRIRLCCRSLKTLIAGDSGLSFWYDLLKGTALSSTAHTIEGGIWLHAMLSEEDLSLYDTLTSRMGLATDLKFKDRNSVKCVLDFLRLTQLEDDILKNDEEFVFEDEPAQNSSCIGRGRCFLGSWSFNAETVKAMLCGKESGPVCSSPVEFGCVQNFFPGTFDFEILLTISRVAGGKFVLSWLPIPSVTMPIPSSTWQFLDHLDFHVHGHTSTPSIPILGYDGNLSKTISATPSPMHVPLMELTTADVMELLEQDGLICAITTHVYCMGQEVFVRSANESDPTERNSYQQTEPFHDFGLGSAVLKSEHYNSSEGFIDIKGRLAGS